MKKGGRAGIGVALCAIGFGMARVSHFREATIRVEANGCQLVTDVVDEGSDQVGGSVVLIHGIAANKKIMAYLADAFAEQGLRVFVPDLPGHGRTPGPFSFARAESCTESLVQQLATRGLIDSKHTLLAGHSMGGAIAVRVAARVDVAGVIALSPAPMRVRPGVPGDALPYRDPPPVHENTLVMTGAFEPFGIRAAARELVAANPGTSKFLLIPGATHVSVLFDRRVARASEDWAATVLGLQAGAPVPSSRMVFGSLLGFAGILLLAGPFIREIVGTRTSFGDAQGKPVVPGIREFGLARTFLEIASASFVAVIVLRFWNPFSFLHLFNGGYFASFLFLTGLLILVAHYKAAHTLFVAEMRSNARISNWPPEDGRYVAAENRPPESGRYIFAAEHGTSESPFQIRRLIAILGAAAFAAVALHLLITGWFDATLSEAWVSASRWVRFPVLLVAALAYFLGEELLLRRETNRGKLAAIALPLALRLIVWVPLVLAIFVLHSGAILLILLMPYIFFFFVLQSAGANVVRKQTGLPLAAALFNAILLAAFCLVIFPVT